ncbi:MAG: dependent oxidoreductase [Herbinix sp.]|nr:dependent oxidoreductase [Herbinix sp.]
MKAIAKALKLPPQKIVDYRIIKKSIDARKNEIKYIYTIDATLSLDPKEKESVIISRSHNENVTLAKVEQYHFVPSGEEKLSHRPIVVGTGPAGLFTAYLLAKNGYQPLVLERGYEVRKRVEAVEHFWRTNELNPDCNVQFGEGGAGTFSDGKLNTLVKDANNRYRLVMETLVSFGAPSDILYLNKPHIGTDQLRYVVENMRKEIIRHGGEVRFGSTLTDLIIEQGSLRAIEVNQKEIIPCELLVTAIGHSARDTFTMFNNRGLELTAKAFAVGLRIEHKQEMISRSQYGSEFIHLPAADYKLTHQTSKGRGVYSFCMCPGGFVVNASSEPGCVAVNGMSNYNRDEVNANSAIVVTIQPEDFGSGDPLSGIEFQRKLEKAAYQAGKGQVPVQLFGDLLRDRDSVTIGNVTPNIKGEYHLTNLNHCLPIDIMDSVKEGILAFDHKIKGFANEEAVLSGVESRTSSPVRIQRDDRFEANIKGIYPCGEGAGYAGGITSAAIDGIKVFEAIAGRFQTN